MPFGSREGPYATYLKRRIERDLLGCVIIKGDSADTQGIPDLFILYGERWGSLEVKISQRAAIQPNQVYWVERLDGMSFAAFICPENEEEVLDALYAALRPRRRSRTSKPQ